MDDNLSIPTSGEVGETRLWGNTLRSENEGELVHFEEAVRDGEDGVAGRDGESSTGEEIVLDVDQE